MSYSVVNDASDRKKDLIQIGKLMIRSFLRRDSVLDYPRRDCFNFVSN